MSEISRDELEQAKQKLDGKEKSNDETLKEDEIEKISAKTEIDVGQKVTDRDTIGSLLNVQGKGYKKIAIIFSKSLQENNNSTTFSFVGIKQDGSVEKIDSLEQVGGIKPNKEVYKLNNDGSKIEEEKMNSIYTIKGKRENQLAVKIGEMGIIETSLIRSPKYNNKEAIGIPIQNKYNMNTTTRETREFMNDQRNPRMNEEISRIEEHKKHDCENFTMKDINDNPNDDTHMHSTIDTNYLDKRASEILENDEISKVYNRKDVIKRLESEIQSRNQQGVLINIEEVVENVEEQMEKDARKRTSKRHK